MIKSYICHTPCPVTYEARSSMSRMNSSNTLPSHAANKPIATSLESMRNQKNEIFIDLLERLTVLVAANVSTVAVLVNTVCPLCVLLSTMCPSKYCVSY